MRLGVKELFTSREAFENSSEMLWMGYILDGGGMGRRHIVRADGPYGLAACVDHHIVFYSYSQSWTSDL